MNFKTLLPKDSTDPEEFAIEEAGATFSPVPVPNASLWNPDACPEHMLPWLATNLAVDLWNPNWPVWKKRKACRDALKLARLKGTQAGLEGYLEQVDAELIEVVTPPSTMFLDRAYTKEQLDDYYGVMPQLRIYPFLDRGVAPIGQFFFGMSFGAYFMPSRARTGRRTFLYDPLDQSSRELVTAQLEALSETRNMVEQTRVVDPGLPGTAFFFGANFFGDVVGVVAKRSVVHTVEVDHAYLHESSELRLSTISPGYEPINGRHEEGTDIWTGEIGAFAFGGAFGDFFIPSEAWQHTFSMVRLYDPDRAPALANGGQWFFGDRMGVAPHTAEIRVQVELPYRPLAWFGGHFGDMYFSAVDTRVIDDALEAVHAAKSAHETILVSFENWREPTFDDPIPLDGSYRFGQLVPWS